MAVATRTLARLHRRIGDVLQGGLADGVMAQSGGAQRIIPDIPLVLFAVRYAPGVSTARAFDGLEQQFPGEVLRHLPAEDVENLRRVGSLPLVVAALVALLGLATLAHTLLTDVRHRGRELAILKTIGFTRRQVFATVASQATTFAAAAILFGLPLGVVAGRWTWQLVADQVGTPAAPVLPLLAIVAVGAGTVLVANAVAAGPAWLAARMRPAVRLHAE